MPPGLVQRPVTLVGTPSVSIENGSVVFGSDSEPTSSERSYTVVKLLGDGYFGTVWLCDWHGLLPTNMPPNPMQRTRPEWEGKRLVAVKRRKQRFEDGRSDWRNLKERKALMEISPNPNLIALYDCFYVPTTMELYLVLEPMEGNLYQLIKARKGKRLAGGLLSSIFHQLVSGLHHVHQAGYIHRDIIPENILVTTTGLFDYRPIPPYENWQRDVVVIVKLGDLSLARDTSIGPPYSEYVTTRWYRPPEVLLLSNDYSTAVDLWSFGVVIAELVTLGPLLPGSSHIDQIAKICEVLGDPRSDYGLDPHGLPLGGGKWNEGIELARSIGFTFPHPHVPQDMYALFGPAIPLSLTQCIIELLRYDPKARLTAAQCLEHAYLQETTPRNTIPFPEGIHMPPPVALSNEA